MRRCHRCLAGDHENCTDRDIVVHDISDADPGCCSCEEGDCAPEVSWACANWLHNCGGCPCDCHDDPKARAIWKEAHSRYVDRSYVLGALR